eukprot:854747-Pleurochrysis_carterae.AAC.5
MTADGRKRAILVARMGVGDNTHIKCTGRGRKLGPVLACCRGLVYAPLSARGSAFQHTCSARMHPCAALPAGALPTQRILRLASLHAQT